jgi:PHD/YefM family antitoxin component YafN of YafNO toxin-antitoxin module
MAKLTLTADELITSTKATKELPRLLDRLPEKRWFIQRNNRLEGVLLSIKEYERLLELEEEVEHLVLALTLAERERRDDGYRVSLDELASRYDVPELR